MATTQIQLRIAADEAYGLTVFRERTGLTKDGLRRARDAGLSLRKVGTRYYVLGRDWIDWLARQELIA